ncbi:FMN-binding protein [Candidatus Dojkabacteria bacterium]|uniref:FMN-binding protein n=1 Tax=Candidatus Dojkabacteria bacterium TaxID=2099670 RepID=A0A955LAI1_9BACT|nr:FMN-binding protein [Candidatus Dojkabacteria bacterium]
MISSKSLTKMPQSMVIGGGVILVTLTIGGIVIYTESQKDSNNENQSYSLKDFKDGSYYAEGSFYVDAVSKTETIGVTVTIRDGKITGLETDQIENGEKVVNEYMQKFEDKIKDMVVGKPITEVGDQTIITGSSLTSKGFVDAVENIRRDAVN